jgi:hypothetical protein
VLVQFRQPDDLGNGHTAHREGTYPRADRGRLQKGQRETGETDDNGSRRQEDGASLAHGRSLSYNAWSSTDPVVVATGRRQFRTFAAA